MAAKTPIVHTGLDRCLPDPPEILRNSKFGLLLNQASVDSQLSLAADVLHEQFPGQLRCLFSPQHGLWCEEQANMIETNHSVYEPLGLPVHSLYSETRTPTAEMLTGLDCLVIDLQDVGTRVYTFIWTMLECLRACAEHHVAVVVLDRPNPLGGLVAEGPLLQESFRSFVGNAEIPVRHGLTVGELARLFRRRFELDVELTVVEMGGWRRRMLFPETGLPWVPPSPNMPRFETAVLYPGQVLLEGTNLSEGRGTTTPFEIVGAPFLNENELFRTMSEREFRGLQLQPVRFRPTFDKWAGETCHGLRIQVTEATAVRSVAFTTALLQYAERTVSDSFQWLPPPYEYENRLMPIDILSGSSYLRLGDTTAAFDEAAWWNFVSDVLIYE